MSGIISTIFGIGASVSLFLIYQQKNRSKLLLCKLSADICWIIHYFYLGAYSGMVPGTVGIFRELIFLNREKHKWCNKIIWPIIFILCNWALGYMTYKTPADLLPIIASTFVTVSLWLKNPYFTKMISVPVSIVFIIYNFYVHSYIGIFNESLSLISLIIFYIKEIKNDRRKKL